MSTDKKSLSKRDLKDQLPDNLHNHRIANKDGHGTAYSNNGYSVSSVES
jgi:hypothetical protein